MNASVQLELFATATASALLPHPWPPFKAARHPPTGSRLGQHHQALRASPLAPLTSTILRDVGKHAAVRYSPCGLPLEGTSVGCAPMGSEGAGKERVAREKGNGLLEV